MGKSSAELSISSTNSTPINDSNSDSYDVALNFLKTHAKNINVEEQQNYELDVNNQRKKPKALLRKLDIYILPFMCAVYFLQYLDKSLLNYAAVMGIKKHLVGNQFANLGTIFYASYIFGEPFISYLLQRFPLSKVLSTCIVLWGIVLAAHSACHTYASLMIVRVLLGILESASAVSLISIGTMYYTKSEQAERIGYWAIQSGMGLIAGGLLSFAFQYVHTTGFESWQILFLVLGCITVVFGIFVWLYLPDNVTNAWFLTDEEKTIVIENVRSNQTGVENKIFKKHQIKELLFHDKFTWLLVFTTIVSQMITGALGTFSVSVTATFGFNNKISSLLQLPTGTIVIICILASTHLVSRYGNLTLVHASMYVPSIIGAVLLIIDSKVKISNLIGLYLTCSGSSAITMIYTWNSVNTAGYTKKVYRNAMTLISFSIASLIGPQLFQAYSYPRYMPAKITILVTQICAIPLSLLIGYLSKKENEKRDRLAQEEGQKDQVENIEFLDLTDIENKNFRYLY
ncbi:hypothetical protein WICMUC_003096 [Wickerhamomyces mucosus]|uniref:Major facilitator superfamily (MFS) profile domain-containing protein n=1 Tax=Wickerhamomyces mucosus TaxID=1378264 RepID=A0A9P8PNC9_9ASCO|nr:hypothetical protein WICMUC_003096 [Wickerhamomyces mucosus]